MKKRIGTIIVLLVVAVIAAVGFYTRTHSNTELASSPVVKTRTKTSRSESKRKTPPASNTKTLVLYYSNSGTTETAAKEIQKEIGGDLVAMQISPAYPTDYGTLTQVAKKQIDDNARPKITNLPNLTNYDTILLGFPTWYHRPPMFINTFFEQATIKGKTIIPFTTSASSPISESTPFLKKMAQGTGAELKDGFRANDRSVIQSNLQKAGLLK